jgi:hypothetical protein
VTGKEAGRLNDFIRPAQEEKRFYLFRRYLPFDQYFQAAVADVNKQ